MKTILAGILLLTSPYVLALNSTKETAPPTAQEVLLENAIQSAIEMYDSVYKKIGRSSMGVDKKSFYGALKNRSFYSKHWYVKMKVKYKILEEDNKDCAEINALAYVNHHKISRTRWTAVVNICPHFYLSLNDQERVQSVLHELVHVVMGMGECRAMAYSYKIQHLAVGSYSFEDHYWNMRSCDKSKFKRP